MFAKVPQGWPGRADPGRGRRARTAGSSGWGVSLGVLARGHRDPDLPVTQARPPADETHPARGATRALMPAPGRSDNSGPVHAKATGMTRFDVRLLLFALAAERGAAPPRPASAAEGNLLAGKPARPLAGGRASERLTDDRAAPEGDFWQTNATASFRDAECLRHLRPGQAVTPIAAAWLQGDNNDSLPDRGVAPTAGSTRRCGTPGRRPAPGCGPTEHAT